MSVKKDPSGRRSVQVEIEVPGTPEEVWRAIATGPGVSSWFVPTKIEEGADGKPVPDAKVLAPLKDAAIVGKAGMGQKIDTPKDK